MPSLWNADFLNHNSQRRYPLADDADGVDESGAFKIPTDFMLEIYLPIHAGLNVDSSRFFIQEISAQSTGYAITIGYQPFEGDAIAVAVAMIPRPVHKLYNVYKVGGRDDFFDTEGRVCVGRLDNTDDQPPGVWTFALEHTRIDPDCVRPILRGISSITCVSGSQRSQPLYGHIEIRVGANMRIAPTIVAGQPTVITISAIDGEGTVEDCVCEGDAALTAPIFSINGVRPKPDGDIDLLAGTCLAWETVENGLKLDNTCAAPCCGPVELERITADLQRLGQQAAAISQFADRTNEAVNTMSLIVLGSKLGQPCATCG